MAALILDAALIVERRLLGGPWGGVAWRPFAVLPPGAAAAPWTPLAHEDGATTFFAGEIGIELHSSETGSYRDNLATREPRLWTVLRDCPEPPGVRLMMLTADPAEGEAMTEAGTNLVETVAMPAWIEERVRSFVAEHHIERPFFKRQRDRSASGHGPAGPPGGGRHDRR